MGCSLFTEDRSPVRTGEVQANYNGEEALLFEIALYDDYYQQYATDMMTFARSIWLENTNGALVY